MSATCFHCGKPAGWRDSLTGANRCAGCLIDRGAGRAHVAIGLPVSQDDEFPEPETGAVEETALDDQDDGPDPVAVWDELDDGWAGADLSDVPAAVRELVEAMLEQGKTQAMELARVRRAVRL